MITQAYFIGAGGIGMAALERYFLSRGVAVAGYDRTPSALTRELEAEGVEMTYDDSADAIPEAFRRPSDELLVVYTPAVPSDSAIMTYFREGGFNPVKRAVALGHITRDSRSICFSGTHGKTTTSSMAAHILHSSRVGCNAFLGGIMLGYNSNLVLSPTSPWTVVEADEYDRSFHQLRPYIAVVNATDPDHLDIYGTEEAYLESFAHFTELVEPGGCLLLHTGLKLKPRPREGVRVYTYGRGEGDFRAVNIRRSPGTITYDLEWPGGVITDIMPGVPVDVNIDNSVAAIAACLLTGDVDPATARAAAASYPGVERRFQMIMRQSGDDGKVVIDDYAHHPDELARSIGSVRDLYPGRRLTVAFQPHLYSRTRDFYHEFAAALSQADDVVLLDIYPAREEPIEGVSSRLIYDLVTSPSKTLIRKEDFVDTLKNRNFDILLAAGAGDMSFMLPELCRQID